MFNTASRPAQGVYVKNKYGLPTPGVIVEGMTIKQARQAILVEVASGGEILLGQGVVLIDDDGATIGTPSNPISASVDPSFQSLATAAALTMASDDTEYTITIPVGARAGEVSANINAAWRISETSGVVAGGGGHPVKAGTSFAFDGPMAAATWYVAHTQGSSFDLHLIYEI